MFECIRSKHRVMIRLDDRHLRWLLRVCRRFWTGRLLLRR